MDKRLEKAKERNTKTKSNKCHLLVLALFLSTINMDRLTRGYEKRLSP